MNTSVVRAGTYKWVMWFTMSFAFSLALFLRYALGTVSDSIAGELQLTGTQLSALSNMYFYAYGLMQIPVGILADKVGIRKVTSTGMIIAGISSLIFCFGKNIYILYITRFFVGLGVSVMLVSIFKMLSVWFRSDEFVKVNGWSSCFGTFGTLLSSAPLAYFAAKTGWRFSFGVASVLCILIGILLFVIVRDYPDGYIHPEKSSGQNVLKEIKETITSPFLIGAFILMLGIFGVSGSFLGLWGMQYFMHIYGMDNQVASTYLMFSTAGTLLGAFSMGYVLKLFRSRALMIKTGCLIFGGTWILVLFLWNGKMPLYIIPAFMFIQGAANTFVSPMYSIVKDKMPKHLTGMSSGFVNLAPFMSSIIINALIGLRLDSTWQGQYLNDARVYTQSGYIQSFSIYIAACMLSFAMALFVLKGVDKKQEAVLEKRERKAA